MEPQRPLLPDTAESHETALGLIPHVNSTSRTSWTVWPLPVPSISKPMTRDRSSGGSAAELALGKISQSSPPPLRGGFIQDRGGGRGQKAMTMDQLMEYGDRRRSHFGHAVTGDTRETAFSDSPLDQVQNRPRSSSKPSLRPGMTRAMDSLQKIPWYHPPHGPEIVTLGPPSIVPSIVDKPLPPPPTQIDMDSIHPTAGFNASPYPLSATELGMHHSPPSLASAQFPETPAKYPRRTGPLPVETFPVVSGSGRPPSRSGRAATMAGTQSSPGTFLYPHAQAPYPTSRGARTMHHHAAGYSSQPMSRDTSAQSKTSSSGRSGNENMIRAVDIERVAPYPLTVTQSAETSLGVVGMSPPYGAVGSGIGIPPRRRADLSRSRASSLAESEPAMSTSIGISASPMGVGRTSYRVFKDEAAYHANDRAYATNSSVPMSRAPSSPRARFAALVDKTMENQRQGGGIEEEDDDVVFPSSEIFEPRNPRKGGSLRKGRGGTGTMSAPQTSVLGQGEWVNRAP